MFEFVGVISLHFAYKHKGAGSRWVAYRLHNQPRTWVWVQNNCRVCLRSHHFHQNFSL